MLFDTHTNLMWYPEHYSDEFVQFAWEAKRAKMKLSPDVYFAGSDVKEQNAFDSRPAQLLEATRDADKVIVFGIKAPFCGINADQELIARFVKEHSDRFIGWCSVDPNDADCVDQLVYYVNDRPARPEMPPIYQNWDPQDPRHLPLFRKANSHPGQHSPGRRPTRSARTEPGATGRHRDRLPRLRIVIAHGASGRTNARHHQAPHLYTNISALHYRPLRHYQAFMTAIEYGVEHKLIFGSDFPSATPAQVIAGQHKVNDVVRGTNLPKVSDEMIHNIIYENWKRFLPEYA